MPTPGDLPQQIAPLPPPPPTKIGRKSPSLHAYDNSNKSCLRSHTNLQELSKKVSFRKMQS